MLKWIKYESQEIFDIKENDWMLPVLVMRSREKMQNNSEFVQIFEIQMQLLPMVPFQFQRLHY